MHFSFDQNKETCELAVKEKIVTKTHASVQDCSEDLDLALFARRFLL